MRKYIYSVGKTNPESFGVIKKIVKSDGATTRFQRIFLCFGGQKKGFLNGCRPFIGVDNCHFKGKYKGILLSAVSVDTNSRVFPLAYAVMKIENFWIWFFRYLKQCIGEGAPHFWTIMTDRQKGILAALENEFPRF